MADRRRRRGKRSLEPDETDGISFGRIGDEEDDGILFGSVGDEEGDGKENREESSTSDGYGEYDVPESDDRYTDNGYADAGYTEDYAEEESGDTDEDDGVSFGWVGGSLDDEGAQWDDAYEGREESTKERAGKKTKNPGKERRKKSETKKSRAGKEKGQGSPKKDTPADRGGYGRGNGAAPGGQRGSGKKKQLSNLQMTLILLACVLVGGAMMVYPWFSNWWNERHQSRAIMQYNTEVNDLPEAEYQALIDAARTYNAALAEKAFTSNEEDAGTPALSDLERVPEDILNAEPEERAPEEDSSVRTGHFSWIFTDEDETEYESLLNYNNDGIIGYIIIPKINVEYPIYHGTSDAVLQTGIGHLEGSSLPVGCADDATGAAASSHAVLCGHRGLPSAKLFTDVDQLTTGDTFTVKVLNEEYTYRVDQISMVDPTDYSDLGLEEGKDYVTLLTCTPYGINTERLLIRGVRDDAAAETESVEETAEVNEDTRAAEAIIEEEHKKPSYILRTFFDSYAPIVAVVITAAMVVLILITGITNRKRGKK